MSLKQAIESLAQEFAEGVLRAARNATLEEILHDGARQIAAAPAASKAPTLPRRRGGRIVRRSPEQIAKVIDAILAELRKAKGGLRSEDLQKKLAVDATQIARPLSEALSSKKIRKTGEKRAMRYFAR